MTVMTVLLLLTAGIAGCTSSGPATQVPAASPAPAQKLSTVAPAEMALQPSDLPAGFVLLEKGDRNISEMRSWSLEHGWKGGYFAAYQKQDGTASSGIIIDQALSVYPAENITLIVPDTLQLVKNWADEDRANRSVEDDPSLPSIGDFSRGMKLSDKNDEPPEYVIVFSKQDVYMELYTNGTAADYATLKNLAGVAEAKIR
ncbi:MAG: hypothetical protein CVV32_09785 [Methanomicrobiales archaeon HGW-Methanomicrobiales-3]|jgi:predicted small lipoprotein YifL|nr:MAG: hypothetical protein CVV32_09785 [Methanomicrobiales archaeon HGW-Methanomicrobiales-3]